MPKDLQKIRSPSYLWRWLGTYQGASVSYCSCCCICCYEAMLLSEDSSWDGSFFLVLSSASRCWSLASFISFKMRWRWSFASFKAAALSMFCVQSAIPMARNDYVFGIWSSFKGIEPRNGMLIGYKKLILEWFLGAYWFSCPILYAFESQRVSRCWLMRATVTTNFGWFDKFSHINASHNAKMKYKWRIYRYHR